MSLASTARRTARAGLRAGRVGLLGGVVLAAAVSIAGPEPARALSMTPFGPGGAGGTMHGQSLELGPGGVVFELDALLHVGGTSTQLSQAGATVSGLAFQFAASLSADTTDLTLSYSFTNTTAAAISNVAFVSFLDAEIDEPLNTFFNEFATVRGTLAAGQSFEIDEPGFAFGNLFANAAANALDGTNALPPGSPDDVAMALQFSIGTLGVGETAIVELMISEDGDTLGSFAIDHEDSDPASTTRISYSGAVRLSSPPGPAPAIPEPGAALSFGLGLCVVALALRRPRHTHSP